MPEGKECQPCRTAAPSGDSACGTAKQAPTADSSAHVHPPAANLVLIAAMIVTTCYLKQMLAMCTVTNNSCKAVLSEASLCYFTQASEHTAPLVLAVEQELRICRQ